jgi:hypothetical protein
MKTFLFALAIQPFLILFICVTISAAVYIIQEINHSIKKIKSAVKGALWEVEWRWNHR